MSCVKWWWLRIDNEDYDYDEEEDYEVKEKKPSRRERKKEEEQQQTAATFDISEKQRQKQQNKITPINRNRRQGQPGMEVCVIKPTTIEDEIEITETLLNGRTVVINMEGLSVDIAQRIIDFTSGATLPCMEIYRRSPITSSLQLQMVLTFPEIFRDLWNLLIYQD